jgi:hypothetical protein
MIETVDVLTETAIGAGSHRLRVGLWSVWTVVLSLNVCTAMVSGGAVLRVALRIIW